MGKKNLNIRKWALRALFFLPVISAMPLQAVTTTSVLKRHPHHLYLGPNLLFANVYSYAEWMKFSDKYKAFGGLELGYEYLTPNQVYAGIDLSYAEGSGSSTWYYKIAGIGDAEVRLGYSVGDNSYLISPFIGAGAYIFRYKSYWSDPAIASSYISGGFRSLFLLRSLFNIGLNAKVIANYGFHTSLNHWKVYKAPRHYWGGEVGVPLIWRVGSQKRWDIHLEPYFVIDDFTNFSTLWGSKLLFGYAF